MLPSKSADALRAPPRTLRARIPEPRGAVSKGPPRLARLLAARPFSQNNRCRGRSRSYNGSRMSISRKAIWLAAGVLCLTAAAFAQRFGRGGFGGFGGFGGGRSEAPESEFSPNAEFHFLRVEYSDYTGRGFGGVSRRGRAFGWWAQDWPDADEHFTKGVQRLTRMDVGDPRHVSLTDEKLFDYPWIYATQVGYWNLSDEETSRLREYLLRGGFIMTDDFWDQNGSGEWEVFAEAMNRVLPGQPITDIGLDDSVMHVLYDIREKDLMFIPGSRHLCGGGQVCQPPGT